MSKNMSDNMSSNMSKDLPEHPALRDVVLQSRIAQFIYRELNLLDNQQWQDWLDLFAEDAVYWAPATHDQPDPYSHVSLIFDDDLLRKVRVARYETPYAFSLQPFPRSSHLVSNVLLEKNAQGEMPDDVINVSARFLMTEFQKDTPIHYSGAYHYELLPQAGDFKIKLKKAILVNCEGAQVSSSIYF